MSITIYGIKNCDTMKKARAWLDDNGIAYRFHDYRVDGIDAATLQLWADRVGWEKLLNKAGTTFRKLPDDQKKALNRDRAIALMVEAPAMIKRPVLDYPGGLLVGFKPGEYGEALL